MAKSHENHGESINNQRGGNSWPSARINGAEMNSWQP